MEKIVFIVIIAVGILMLFGLIYASRRSYPMVHEMEEFGGRMGPEFRRVYEPGFERLARTGRTMRHLP